MLTFISTDPTKTLAALSYGGPWMTLTVTVPANYSRDPKAFIAFVSEVANKFKSFPRRAEINNNTVIAPSNTCHYFPRKHITRWR